MDRDLFGGFDAEADALSADFEDLVGDVVADLNRLAFFSVRELICFPP